MHEEWTGECPRRVPAQATCTSTRRATWRPGPRFDIWKPAQHLRSAVLIGRPWRRLAGGPPSIPGTGHAGGARRYRPQQPLVRPVPEAASSYAQGPPPPQACCKAAIPAQFPPPPPPKKADINAQTRSLTTPLLPNSHPPLFLHQLHPEQNPPTIHRVRRHGWAATSPAPPPPRRLLGTCCRVYPIYIYLPGRLSSWLAPPPPRQTFV